MATTAQQLHVDGTALKKVHDTMKKDIGAVKNLFSQGPKPNTNYIKTLAEDATSLYGLSNEEKAAALYIFCLAKVKGTETAEYNNLLGVLRHSCPKPPSDDSEFLPYLSFLCAPDRRKYVRDDRFIDSKQYDPNDNGLIMPPHPQCVERPIPPQRHAFTELTALLSRGGDAVNFATFAAAMKDVDRGVSTADAKRLFTEGFIFAKVGGKMEDKTTVPVRALLEVCRPQLTMERQKSRSSSLVKGAFTWDVPAPPTPTKGGSAALGSSRNGTSPRGSPRRSGSITTGTLNGTSPRSSSSSSARKGFQPTRSAELRQQMATDQLNDPTSPYYNKGVYKHIPAVPESHYKKQSTMNLTSRYSVRREGSISPRRPAAAEDEPAAQQQKTDAY